MTFPRLSTADHSRHYILITRVDTADLNVYYINLLSGRNFHSELASQRLLHNTKKVRASFCY